MEVVVADGNSTSAATASAASRDGNGLLDCMDGSTGGLPSAVCGESNVAFRLNKNLIAILAQYFPQDGTVVDADLNLVLERLRYELEYTLQQTPKIDRKQPLYWQGTTGNSMADIIPGGGWIFMILKIHQMISQMVKLSPKNPTLRRTNGYETVSLMAAAYQSVLGRIQGDFTPSQSSTDSSTLSTVPELVSGNNEKLKHTVPAPAVNATDALVETISLSASKLWADDQTIYIVFQRDCWNDDTNVPAAIERQNMIVIPVDEGHVSMSVSCHGRFDAYLLAALCESILPLIRKSEMLKLPIFLVEDERMIVSRARHARRVFRDSTSTYCVTQGKFDWYVTLLTSGSLRAVQDTFVDFAQETWHAQFNRGIDEASANRLEELMIALLGHPHDMVRSQSSVCLNNLIDRHDWQQEVPFLPIIKQVGADYVINVTVTDVDLPTDTFIISMAPSPFHNHDVYTYHTLEWIATDSLNKFRPNNTGSAVHTRSWKGVCNLGKFSRPGFYDWRLVKADRTSGSWRVIHATLDSLHRQCTGSFSFANLSSEDDLEFTSRNLWPELGRLKEAQEATGHSHFKTLPIQGRFIVQPENTRYMNLHEIDVDLCGAKFHQEKGLAERGSFTKVTERLDQLKEHGIDGLCLLGCQARNNGEVQYDVNGIGKYENEDASPFAVTCRGSVCELLGGRRAFDDLYKECNRRNIKLFIEFQNKISICGSHRKYDNVKLQCIDYKGHLKLLEGGYGKYVNIDESSELNYRCKKSWDLYIEDLLAWVSTRCDGIKLDTSHLLPRIYEADYHELNRFDPDLQSHYSPMQRITAPVVIPTNKDAGFWTSTAATSHWPNPFLIKICKAIWNANPKALVLGDCALLQNGCERKIGTLSRSGIVPFLQSMPVLLSSIFTPVFAILAPEFKKNMGEVIGGPFHHEFGARFYWNHANLAGAVMDRSVLLQQDLQRLDSDTSLRSNAPSDDAVVATSTHYPPKCSMEQHESLPIKYFKQSLNKLMSNDLAVTETPDQCIKKAIELRRNLLASQYTAKSGDVQKLTAVSTTMPPAAEKNQADAAPVRRTPRRGRAARRKKRERSAKQIDTTNLFPPKAFVSELPFTTGKTDRSAFEPYTPTSCPVPRQAYSNDSTPSTRCSAQSRTPSPPLPFSPKDSFLKLYKTYNDILCSSEKDAVVEPAESIAKWYERLHESLPEGGLVVQSSTTAQSALPALMYKRGAWPATDLLLLSTDMPCTIQGEDEGKCLRRGVANFNTQENPSTDPMATMHREDSNVMFSRARSVARFEDPKDVEKLEEEYAREFPPTSGQDLRRISVHYKHRREFRRRFKLLCDAPMMPIKAYDENGEKISSVFATCRIGEKTQIAIVGTNFSEVAVPHVEVHISFLSKVISNRHPPSGALVEVWDLFGLKDGTFDGSVCQWKKHCIERGNTDPLKDDMVGLMTLPELLSFPHHFPVSSYQSAGLGFKVLEGIDQDDDVMLALYLSALRRLATLFNKTMTIPDLKAQTKEALRLRTAIQSNYIVQSLITTTRTSDSMNELSVVLTQVARAYEWHKKLTGIDLAPLSEILTSVGVLTNDNPVTAVFFAKLNRIVDGIKALPKAGEASARPESLDDLLTIGETLTTLQTVTPIVFVTSELGKWSTVGGLGVMVDELSSTLATELGYESIVMCPYYHVNRKGETDYMKSDGIEWVFNIQVRLGPDTVTFGVHTGVVKNVKLIFLHNEAIWHHPYPDNTPADAVRMLSAFGKAFLEALCQMKIIPQIVVTNDWATGLIPAYAKKGWFGDIFNKTTFFHIVHNFDPAYEGRIYPPAGQDYTWIHELPRDDLIDPLWATPIINPSRCVLLNCDQWGTVSPSYRDELMGRNGTSGASPLAYLLNRFPQPFAVCNGVPIRSRKAKIASLGRCSTHEEAKAELQRKYFGFEKPDLAIPLFSFIGRVTTQKGVHMILESAESIIQRYNNRVQILVGGPVTWKDPYSAKCGHMMLYLKNKYPWSFYASPNEFFSDGTLVNVGSDFGLMPSMFEPGGIVQHEFFVAGTPVLAFKTGGLKDTVHEFDPETNTGNGFNFASYNVGDYVFAFERAMRVFSDPAKYKRLRVNAEKSVHTCEQCGQSWMKEFCRLRNKIMLDPKAVRQASLALPSFNPKALDNVPSVSEIMEQLKANRLADQPAMQIQNQITPQAVVQFRLYYARTSRSVCITGSYDQWSSRRPLHWDNSLGCFNLDMALAPGTYYFKFIVDGTWVCSDFHKKEFDEKRIENNVIVIQ